jgi:ABC-2 type transport system ATP-binding protein
MAATVIRAERVSKTFRVGQRAGSLKERLVGRGARTEPFQALTDITLDIDAGRTVGLIGPNGGGKSTLLKVLAGILRPTSGTVRADGRIASLLELGAGFNGELSGRENVFLNGSLLGLPRREVERQFDSIVDFAELGAFIDGPVKHYSSGMYVRLGFAVAVHVDPDILLVDEVLAVGDEAFQRKCLDRIAEFQADGRTILFVSHALDLVERICDRALVLDHGRLVFDGDAEYATGTLRGLLARPGAAPARTAPAPTGVVFRAVRFTAGPAGPDQQEYRPGGAFTARVELDVDAGHAAVMDRLDAVAMGAGGIPVWTMAADRAALPAAAGPWVVAFTVPAMPSLRGRFVLAVSASTSDGTVVAARTFPGHFTVVGDQAVGLIGVPYTVASLAAAPS